MIALIQTGIISVVKSKPIYTLQWPTLYILNMLCLYSLAVTNITILTLQAYQEKAYNLEQQLLPGVNLTKEQLFFVASAQVKF